MSGLARIAGTALGVGKEALKRGFSWDTLRNTLIMDVGMSGLMGGLYTQGNFGDKVAGGLRYLVSPENLITAGMSPVARSLGSTVDIGLGKGLARAGFTGAGQSVANNMGMFSFGNAADMVSSMTTGNIVAEIRGKSDFPGMEGVIEQRKQLEQLQKMNEQRAAAGLPPLEQPQTTAIAPTGQPPAAGVSPPVKPPTVDPLSADGLILSLQQPSANMTNFYRSLGV